MTELQGVNAGDIIAMRLDNQTTGAVFWAFANANEVVNGQKVGHLWNYGLNTVGLGRHVRWRRSRLQRPHRPAGFHQRLRSPLAGPIGGNRGCSGDLSGTRPCGDGAVDLRPAAGSDQATPSLRHPTHGIRGRGAVRGQQEDWSRWQVGRRRDARQKAGPQAPPRGGGRAFRPAPPTGFWPGQAGLRHHPLVEPPALELAARPGPIVAARLAHVGGLLAL